MSRGVNMVMLIGNCGADPDIRLTQTGVSVAKLSVATSDYWRDKQSGDLQESTEWHRVVFFNKLADYVGKYVVKGSKLYINGRLRTRKWQDKMTGADRYTTEIIANELQVLDARSSNHPAQRQEEGEEGYNNSTAPAQNAQGNSIPQELEDDIPF